MPIEELSLPFDKALDNVDLAPNSFPVCTVSINRTWLSYLLGAAYILTDENLYNPLGDVDTSIDMAQRLIALLADGLCDGELIMEFIQAIHVLPNDTNGGAITADTWNDRPLNELRYDTTGAAVLASNVLTLPTGTWIIYAESVIYQPSESQLAVYEDGGGILISGLVGRWDAGHCGIGTACGLLVSDGTLAIRLKHFTRTTRATGLGDGYTIGNEHVYATLNCLKIAD